MKILSWNLNHKSYEKAIPPDLVELFVALDAEVVLLNEFVDGPTRGPFRESLCSAGYRYQLVSLTPARHNQVFAAARRPFRLGDISPPTFDGSAVSNFLHIRFGHTPVELVGLRVPTYKRAADLKAYWAELVAIMRLAGTRPIVFAGDINIDLFAKADKGHGPGLSLPGCDAYRVAEPTGDWSYIHNNGNGFRIDYALHTNLVRVDAPSYVAEHAGRVLAGPASSHPISDHAALTFTVGPHDAPG